MFFNCYYCYLAIIHKIRINMDRKEFLLMSLKGVAAAGAVYCLGCNQNSNPVAAPANVNFTIDLSESTYASLKNNGGSYTVNGIIIINAGTEYRAFSQACTHEGRSVNYSMASSHQLYCPAHGSYFSDTTGARISGPASSGLKKYTVTLSGTKLTISG